MAKRLQQMSEIDLIKAAVHTKFKYLTEVVEIKNILASLYSENVIDLRQKEEIEACHGNKGSTAAGDLFWAMGMKDKISLSKFMDIMRKDDHWIYGTLTGFIEEIKTGKLPLRGELDIKGIREKLQKIYRARDWSDLMIIPDEESVSTSLSEKMLTPVFDVKQVEPQALTSAGMIRKKSKLSENNFSKIQVKCLQGVLEKLSLETDTDLTDLQPNLVELLGVAGTGKTTAVKQLAWLWASDKCEFMRVYDLVFYIPVREVCTDNRLTDILCDLGLLSRSEEDALSQYLESKVLFILDGCDENDISTDKDLHDLVTGRLFPGSKVLITARPEAKCLASFDKKPRVKVTLHGTDKASVDRMLADAVKGASLEEVEKFKERYEEKISDMNLLYVPLYLTLLCIVFKDEFAKKLTCTDLRIPETMTMLFNSLLNVIVRRWLQKTKHKSLKITFSNSPLDSNSNVPSEVKRIIYCLGRVCYKGLMENKYTFSDTDAGECMLDMAEVKVSGLFTVGASKEGEIFFTKHKQLQEYLASLYLAFEGTREHTFHDITHNDSNKGKFLAEMIRDYNIVKVVQFACGLSAKFLQDIFSNAASMFSLMKGGMSTIDIYYECVLFTEQHMCELSTTSGNCNPVGYNEFKHYLYATQIKKTNSSSIFTNSTHTIFQKCLHKITTLFNKDLAVDLLSRLYDVRLDPVPDGNSTDFQLADSPTPKSNITFCLDQLQSELLSFVRIQGVQSLHAYPGVVFVDLPVLLKTFPQLTHLDVSSGPYIPYSGVVRLDSGPSTKLTKVTLRSLSSLHTRSLRTSPLPNSHIESLLQQQHLMYLNLLYVPILSELSRSSQQQDQYWPHLKHLTLYDTYLCLSDSEVNTLCAILQTCSASLTELVVVVTDVPKHSVTQLSESLKSLKYLECIGFSVYDRQDYTQQILTQCLPHLTNLRKLEMWPMRAQMEVTEAFIETLKSLKNLEHFSVVDNIDVKCEVVVQILTNCLPHLTNLNTVTIPYDNIINSEAAVTEALCTSSSLRTLRMLYSYGKLSESITQKLEEKKIQIVYNRSVLSLPN